MYVVDRTLFHALLLSWTLHQSLISSASSLMTRLWGLFTQVTYAAANISRAVRKLTAYFTRHLVLSATLSTPSLRFNGHIPGEPGWAGICWSIGWWRWWWRLDYWSYKSCKAPVKSSSPTNQHPVFLEAGCPSCCPTNSVKALKGKISHSTDLLTYLPVPQAHLGSSNFVFDHW